MGRLERIFGPLAVPNLTLVLIVPQVLLYGLFQLNLADPERIVLVPRLVMAGEVWRLVTFLAMPPASHPIFAFLFWYFFYLTGTALEAAWGTVRYNLYLLIGYVATVAVSFIVPDAVSSNAFLQGSVFLAFARLYPDFQLYIFFIIPVKIKWLAWLAWAGYLLVLLLDPSWIAKLLVLASVLNFLVFFGASLVHQARTGRRHMKAQARAISQPTGPRHQCLVCGITEQSHRQMDFRYCTKCEGSCCYCIDHLHTHEHVVKSQPSTTA